MRNLLRPLALFLPALFPSWRFFQEIKPSPRVEIALRSSGDVSEPDWRPLAPVPRRLSALEFFVRLFWSPSRNDALYLLTCVEKLLLEESSAAEKAHAQTEIWRRVRAIRSGADRTELLQFRILTLRRDGDEVTSKEVYRSDLEPQRGAGR